jgi:hypothetical protein
MNMAGVWVADGDGSNATLLYDAAGSPGEEIVGWLDDTTAVLSSWSHECGNSQLRLVDVVSQQVTMLEEGCFLYAEADGWFNDAIFATTSGLYFVTTDNLTPTQISTEQVSRIDPLGPQDYAFKVRFENGGMATFGATEYDYQVSPATVPSGSLDVAMYGAIWGWTSMDETQPGVWITGPGLEIGQVFNQQARLPIWDPHNNLLFFSPGEGGGYRIFRTTFDAYYQDLTVVDTIDAPIFYVTWLGDTNPYD